MQDEESPTPDEAAVPSEEDGEPQRVSGSDTATMNVPQMYRRRKRMMDSELDVDIPKRRSPPQPRPGIAPFTKDGEDPSDAKDDETP